MTAKPTIVLVIVQLKFLCGFVPDVQKTRICVRAGMLIDCNVDCERSGIYPYACSVLTSVQPVTTDVKFEHIHLLSFEPLSSCTSSSKKCLLL